MKLLRDTPDATIRLPLRDSGRNQRGNRIPTPSGLPQGTDEAEEQEVSIALKD